MEIAANNFVKELDVFLSIAYYSECKKIVIILRKKMCLYKS